MASPSLQYDELTALASNGGYNLRPSLSELSAVFLLSSCVVLQQKWFWQKPIDPIDDNEYQDILSMIETTMAELMTNFGIGQIIPSVTDLSANDGILELLGQTIAQADYPELAATCPSSWLSGSDIILPDMTETSLHGNDGADVGDIVGENDVILTIGQLAAHTHTQNPHSHTYNQAISTPTAAGLEPALASLVTVSPSVTGNATAINNNTGNDEPHNNVPQSLSVRWFIVAR